MTLLIKAKDVETVSLKMDPKVVMRQAVAAVEEAHRETARDPSHNFHWRRINVRRGNGRQVRVGTFMGAVPNAVTSANSPVFDGYWLEPGQHVTGLVAENKGMFSAEAV